MHVIATAGHVDHGKSTLVLALTGTDPDRWAEEKARGLTIDIGFAHATMPGGHQVSFIDVLGHVKFLKNMLAGVGGVDACLFIVAATEGWKPQSEEHLRILQLLGIRRGIIALTKVGLIDDDWEELARLDVSDHVADTFLEAAPIIGVDAPTGRGLEQLRMALDQLCASTPTAVDRGRARLWVDRVFAAKGSGTVVTGTLTGGSMHIDDNLEIIRTQTNGASVLAGRIRSLQSHGRSTQEVGPGNRVAVNISGISHDELTRGDALVHPDRWHRTARFDARLTVLASLDHRVSRRGAYVVYIGSGEHSAKVRILGDAALDPGSTGTVRIHLPTEVPLLPGDRFVLRESGRDETVGGGGVLDVDPRRPASKAAPDDDPQRVVRERVYVDLHEYERLTGTSWTGAVVGTRWAMTDDELERRESALRVMVEGAGALGLDISSLSEVDRSVLERIVARPQPEGVDTITLDGARATLRSAPDALANHPFLAALEASPFSPPDATGVDRAELRELLRKQRVIESDGAYFAPSAVDEATRRLHRLLQANPEGITVAAIRDELGGSRKHVLPLVAHLDATGRTRRRGDVRVAGPRMIRELGEP